MTSIEASRKVRTYGKSKVKLASSHRDWLATMNPNEGRDQSTSKALDSPALTAPSQAERIDALISKKIAERAQSKRETGFHVDVSDHDQDKENKVNTKKQPRQRVISLSSDTSTNSGGSSDAISIKTKRTLAKKQFFVVDSPPETPPKQAIIQPAKSGRPTALARKDSNHHALKVMDLTSPNKVSEKGKEAASAPLSESDMFHRAVEPTLQGTNSHNLVPKTSSGNEKSAKTVSTSLFPHYAQTPLKPKPKPNTPSVSTFATMHVGGPRGHGHQATVAWRRPLTPLPSRKQAQVTQKRAYGLPKTATPTVLSRSLKVDLGQAKRVPVIEIAAKISPPQDSCTGSPFPSDLSSVKIKGQTSCRQSSSSASTTVASPLSSRNSAMVLNVVAHGGSTAMSPTGPSSLATEETSETTLHKDSMALSPDLLALLASSDNPGECIEEFESFTSKLPCPGTTSTLQPSWRKLGEATYSEVFVATSLFEEGKETVVKIIPLYATSVEQETGSLKDLPQTSYCRDVLREVQISNSLSSRRLDGEKMGFSDVEGVYIVRGSYPSCLLLAWDAHKAALPHASENIRPDAFPSDQCYALLCLTHGGTDLENVKLKSWQEAVQILWQAAKTLSAAETNRQFEHRDLHWGNILVRPSLLEDRYSRISLDDAPSCLAATAQTLEATIIDFTLSRIRLPNSADDGTEHVLYGGLDDESIFEGQGDYQYECYRIMRRLVKDDWQTFCPLTNVVWLHYLVCKLLKDKKIRKPAGRRPANTIANLSSPRVARSKQLRQKAAPNVNAALEKAAWDTLIVLEGSLSSAVKSALQKAENLNGAGKPRRSRPSAADMENTMKPNERQILSALDFVKYWKTL